jgi:hypothetical protein
MASGKSTAQGNQTLDLWLGATAPTPPATYYVKLFTVAPSAAGGGTEVTGGSYVRKAITNNPTNWPNAANRRKSNGVAITFVQATANWGNVVAVALMSAATGGTQYYFGLLTRAVLILNGQTREFPIGALEVVEN